MLYLLADEFAHFKLYFVLQNLLPELFINFPTKSVFQLILLHLYSFFNYAECWRCTGETTSVSEVRNSYLFTGWEVE